MDVVKFICCKIYIWWKSTETNTDTGNFSLTFEVFYTPLVENFQSIVFYTLMKGVYHET